MEGGTVGRWRNILGRLSGSVSRSNWLCMAPVSGIHLLNTGWLYRDPLDGKWPTNAKQTLTIQRWYNVVDR